MPDNWLEQHDYNAVLLPRRDLAPADVLMRIRENYSLKVGGIETLFSSGAAAPEPTLAEPSADFAGGLDRSVEVGFAMVVLDAVFGSAISTKLGPDTDIKHGKQLELTYEDIVRDSLVASELEAWLEGADVEGPEEAQGWLSDDKLAVATAVLKTAKLSLVAYGDDGEVIELRAPEIQEIVGDEAVVTAGSDTSPKVTFEVKVPVVFAFQASRLIYEDGAFRGLEAWTAASELSAVGEAKVEDPA